MPWSSALAPRSRSVSGRASRIHACFAALFMWAVASISGAEIISAGSGTYLNEIPAGAKGAPRAYRTKAFGNKVPSNDWWSSLVWSSNTFAHFPHPLAMKVEHTGLRVAYPGNAITANKAAIFGGMPGGSNDLIIGHSAVDRFDDFSVEGASDWFVTIGFTEGSARLRLSYGHGSPFVYGTVEGGAARITLGRAPVIWSETNGATAAVLETATIGLTVNGRHYGLFAPAGAKWERTREGMLTCRSTKPYFSVAVLPDATAGTLALFQKHAHAHVIDSRVDWSYDETTAAVTTRFSVTTTNYEGSENRALLALYPHQWRNTSSALVPLSYGSIRGTMKLAAAREFTTVMTFPGVLPVLPFAPTLDKSRVEQLLKQDFAKPLNASGDTYWAGKQLGRAATAVPIAEAAGARTEAERLLQELRRALENWFTAWGSNGLPKSRNVFARDEKVGTLIGYPASFGSNTELNDHHFHYGYFIKAAAEMARHDRAWGSAKDFGAMVKLLVRDIASAQHDDPDFPFLRCFDPYAGHSWASGHARFGDGNNNESSSEAMNAWSGVILFGEAIADRELRDLGIYLFTTEMNAINEYWFNVREENFPASYPASVVTMVWGGKGANATWFSGDPQMIHGINFLPLQAGSLYLGLYPGYAAKNYRALMAEHGSDRFTGWADILWMYRALSDPEDAARLLAGAGDGFKVEAGNSRANVVYWIEALKEFGRPVRDVTADHPIYAVLQKGDHRSYAAYNFDPKSKIVRFSDGRTMTVKPGELGVSSYRLTAK